MLKLRYLGFAQTPPLHLLRPGEEIRVVLYAKDEYANQLQPQYWGGQEVKRASVQRLPGGRVRKRRR